MAANNYFGFTHSGAQYAPTGAAPYQTTQPGYAVAPSAAAAAASYPQRAAPTGYDTAYPAAAAAATHTQPGPYAAVQAGSTAPTATYDYAGYAVARSAQPAYDTTKTYYQQQAPAAASYTSTDYPGGGGGGKPQYGGGGGSYSSQAAGAGRGVSAGGGGSAAAAVAAQKAAAAAAVAYSGGAAYAAVQQPSSGGGAGGGYASTAYGSQQQSSQQGKLIGSSLHRNLSSVAEYAQPSQQRSVQTFAPKQVKKPFHAQSSNAVVTTVTMPAAGSVAAVTSYQSVGNQPANNYSNSQQTTQNSYTAQVQQNTAFTAAAKPKTGGAIVISKPAAATYTNYDAALYSAATMYVAQQAGGGGGGGKSGNTWQGGGVGGYKKMGGGNMSKPVRQKLPPKPQQLHYCDVCKISCAGPQTYKEHLEGQKHKKKEASMKAGGATPSSTRGANALRCELCDVTCTGSDAYAAHIRGAKHQKVVKLHTKLGKPIPAVDPKAGPAVLAAAGATAVKSETTIVATKINFVAAGNLGTVKTELASSSATPAASAVATCGRGVSSATSNNSQSAAAAAIPVAAAAAASAADNEDSSATSAAAVKTDDVEMAVSATDNITPVGHEYIEEILNDEGKPISFNCKLCECKFNDPNAKLMHMKGRRHRLQFKKKVNPDLVVDVKTSLRQRRIQEEKQRKQAMRDDYFRRREEERMMEVEERMYWEERRRYEEEMEYYEWYNNRRHHGPRGAMGPPPPPPLPPPPPPYGPPPPAVMAGPPGPGGPKSFFPGGVGSLAPPLHLGGPGGHIRRLDTTNDDRHVIARHAAIYPKETELQAVQKIVSHVEKALKLVSDHLADTSKATASATGVGGGTKGAAPATPTKGGGKNAALPLAARNAAKKEAAEGRAGNLFSFQREKEEANSSRVLKGVMRVGVLAKGLLLAGDTDTQLVMLCADKPTRSLLAKVAANLPAQLKSVAADETYTVVGKPDEAAIVIATGSDPKMSVTVTLTSPVVREQLIARTADGGQGGTAADMTSQPPGGGGARGVDPPDLLNKAKCLEGLAALRHAKWFQARVNGLQSCVMVIRILRDLCIRNPTWAPLNSWAMELLAEKVVSSAGRPISVATALRRIMEALASGLLLAPHGPGLLDPCEKEPTDAAASLTAQQREDITASAQHALRLMAFRQIHKVLGMEMLQPPAKFRSGGSGGGGQRGFARKRRRDNSTGEGNESEAGDGKKDKKDDTATVSVKMEK